MDANVEALKVEAAKSEIRVSEIEEEVGNLKAALVKHLAVPAAYGGADAGLISNRDIVGLRTSDDLDGLKKAINGPTQEFVDESN